MRQKKDPPPAQSRAGGWVLFVRAQTFVASKKSNRLFKAIKGWILKGQEETLKTYTEEEQEALTEKPRRNASFAEWRTWAIVNLVL